MHDIGAMPARLASFLSAVDGTRTASVTRYEVMTGGYSRSMARAGVAWSDGTAETLVLRGDPPVSHAMMETDRDAEWVLLSALTARRLVPMPAARYYDGTGEALGTKCIVLEHCDGPSVQSVLAAIDRSAGFGEHPAAMARMMASLHAIEPSELSEVLAVPESWDSYMDGLIGTFAATERNHVESVPFLRYVGAWLDAHRPPPLPLRLVHGDFQAANMMVGADGGHLMIDWELAHIGDPREDLGYYNVYSSASGPNLYLVDPEAFLAEYRARTGFSEDAVNQDTMSYFTGLASIRVYAAVLGGAAAMAKGLNGGLMTTYVLNALTVGHGNQLTACRSAAEVS